MPHSLYLRQDERKKAPVIAGVSCFLQEQSIYCQTFTCNQFRMNSLRSDWNLTRLFLDLYVKKIGGGEGSLVVVILVEISRRAAAYLFGL